MTTLTPTQLAEIEARADAATKGPWIAAAHGSGVVGWPVVASSGRSVCAINYVHHSAIDPAVPGDKAFNAESKRNAAFLAHARQDIPALIAHARALEAENERLRAPSTASADAWNVFLSEHRDAPEFVAVKIAEAIEALECKIYLPGQWSCPKCGFRLTQRTLHAADGCVSTRDQTGERCGNCDVPLWRVAALDEVNEAYQQANRAFDMRQEVIGRAEKAEAERDRLRAECERLRAGTVAALHVARDRIVKRADEHRDKPDLYEEYTAGLDDAAGILRQEIDEKEAQP